MKKLLSFFILSSFILSSCSDDKKDNTEFESSDIPYVEGTSERQYLEETATALLELFNPSDQRQLIQALDYFAYVCENGYFPSETLNSPARSASALAQALGDANYMALSRAAADFTFSLSQYYGLYQYNESYNEWQKIEDSSDLRFRFWFNQLEYNLIVSGSSDSWTRSFTSDGQTVEVEIPKVLHIDLIVGSSLKAENIMSIKINSDFKEGDHLNFSAVIDAANIYIENDLSGSNSKIDETFTLYVDNVNTLVRTTALSSKITISGSRLCYDQSWIPDADEQLPAFSLISDVTSTTKIMRRVQLKSQISDMASFAKYCDFYADEYSSSDPRSEAEAAAAAMSRSVKAEMFYAGNTSKVRANLGWEAYRYSDYTDTWCIRPTITFTSDNTPYSLENYFGNGRFLGVENRIKELIRSYTAFFNAK